MKDEFYLRVHEVWWKGCFLLPLVDGHVRALGRERDTLHGCLCRVTLVLSVRLYTWQSCGVEISGGTLLHVPSIQQYISMYSRVSLKKFFVL